MIGLRARNSPAQRQIRQQRRAERLAKIEAARPPTGMISQRAARRMFEASAQNWKRWRLLGWVSGTQVGRHWYFDRAEMERLVSEMGTLGPPYPDPHRPGVFCVPIRGTRMRRDNVVIDAESLPLIEGKFLNWAPDRDPQTGRRCVAISAVMPVPLRRVIMGVSDTGIHVVHANGDPLDCRRENLLIKTVAEHCQGNRKSTSRAGRPCTSRFKGVCWDKRNER